MTVYLLRCADSSLYCGIAKNAVERCLAHNAGKGSKYVRSRLPVVLVWTKTGLELGKAMRLEDRIKRMPKAEKEVLVGGW
jgi:putative endonuclease